MHFPLLLILSAYTFAATTKKLSVSYSNGKYSYTDGIDEDYQVIAQYDSIENGVNLEKIVIKATSDTYSDDACRAIGFVEGYLLASQISYAIQNRFDSFATQLEEANVTNETFTQFVTSNYEYVANQTNTSATFWITAKVFYLQFQGMLAGYNEKMPNNQIDETTLWYLQALGERHDLLPFLASNGTYYSDADIPNNWMTASGAHTMVRLRTSGLKELYFGHSAYDSYAALQRISKRISYITPSNERVWVAMTTSAGCIGSTDEFYLTGNRLAVASSKMASFNSSHYTDTTPITPSGAMGWLRAMVANLLSDSAELWAYYSTLDSTFTDTKTTLVADYNLFDHTGDSASDMAPSNTLCAIETYPQTYSDTNATTNYYVLTDFSSDLANDKHFFAQNAPITEQTYIALGYNTAISGNETREFYLGLDNSSRFKNFDDVWKKNTSNLLTFEKCLRYNAYKCDDYAVVDGLDVRDPCAQFGAHCELRSDDSGLTKMAYGLVGSSLTSYYSLKYKNFALSVGAAPIYDTDAMSVSDMAKKSNFSTTGMSSTLMDRDYDMVAAIYERQHGIRLVMMIILIVASSIAFIAIIAAIIVGIRSCLKKRAAAQAAYGYYDQSPMN